jgi:hypothetical protein
MKVHPSAPKDLEWRISRTCDSGACVMVARYGDSVLFGDPGRQGGPVFSYTVAEWEAFLAGVRLGDFDDIAET